MGQCAVAVLAAELETTRLPRHTADTAKYCLKKKQKEKNEKNGKMIVKGNPQNENQMEKGSAESTADTNNAAAKTVSRRRSPKFPKFLSSLVLIPWPHFEVKELRKLGRTHAPGSWKNKVGRYPQQHHSPRGTPRDRPYLRCC